MRAEQLEELETHIREGGSKVALDSEEVSLVDVDVVPFLGACEVGSSDQEGRIVALSRCRH